MRDTEASNFRLFVLAKNKNPFAGRQVKIVLVEKNLAQGYVLVRYANGISPIVGKALPWLVEKRQKTRNCSELNHSKSTENCGLNCERFQRLNRIQLIEAMPIVRAQNYAIQHFDLS